jgi:hypothetical protein
MLFGARELKPSRVAALAEFILSPGRASLGGRKAVGGNDINAGATPPGRFLGSAAEAIPVATRARPDNS